MGEATEKQPSKRGILEGAPIGNANAAKSRRLLGDTLKRELAQHPERAVSIARKLLDCAEAGEPWAQSLVFERVDGKMPQAIVGDDDEPALKFSRVLRTIVDPQLPAPDANPEPTDR